MIRVLFLMVVLLAGCATVPTDQQILDAQVGAPPQDYERLVKEYFGKSLFDPYSAVYELGHPVRGWAGGSIFAAREYAWVICGTLNAKNRFGGYVGGRPL